MIVESDRRCGDSVFRREILLFCLLFLIVCIPLWAVKYPAILDYPTHLTRVNIAREAANPALDYSTYYRFSWHFTYLYFDFTTYILSFLFGVFYAGKLALTVYLLLLIAATRYLLKSMNAPIFPFILWPMLFAYNWLFWIGSINLLTGFCLGMFAIGMVWKERESLHCGPLDLRLWRRVTLLIGLSFVCHPISAFLTAMIVFPIIIASWFQGRRAILPFAVFVLITIGLQTLLHIQYHQPWELLTNLRRAQWLLHDFYASPTQAQAQVRVFKIAFCAVFCLWIAFKKDIFRCIFLPGFLLMQILIIPHSIDISGDNDLRCTLFAFLLMPFMAPFRSGKPRGIKGAAISSTSMKIIVSIIFLSCAVSWNTDQLKKQLRFDGTYREIEQIARLVPQAPRVRQLLTFSGREDQQAPVYITYYRGGFSPFMFASVFHGLTYRKRPACVFPEVFQRLDPQCAAFYNCLIVCKNEGSNPGLRENDLVALGFIRRFEGEHFDCYLKSPSDARMY